MECAINDRLEIIIVNGSENDVKQQEITQIEGMNEQYEKSCREIEEMKSQSIFVNH